MARTGCMRPCGDLRTVRDLPIAGGCSTGATVRPGQWQVKVISPTPTADRIRQWRKYSDRVRASHMGLIQIATLAPCKNQVVVLEEAWSKGWGGMSQPGSGAQQMNQPGLCKGALGETGQHKN